MRFHLCFSGHQSFLKGIGIWLKNDLWPSCFLDEIRSGFSRLCYACAHVPRHDDKAASYKPVPRVLRIRHIIDVITTCSQSPFVGVIDTRAPVAHSWKDRITYHHRPLQPWRARVGLYRVDLGQGKAMSVRADDQMPRATSVAWERTRNCKTNHCRLAVVFSHTLAGCGKKRAKRYLATGGRNLWATTDRRPAAVYMMNVAENGGRLRMRRFCHRLK